MASETLALQDLDHATFDFQFPLGEQPDCLAIGASPRAEHPDTEIRASHCPFLDEAAGKHKC